MGQLRFILYKISKLLPKGQRRPIIMISSILGLVIFFQVMTRYSGSIYLVSLQKSLVECQRTAQKEGVMGLVVILFCVLIVWGGFRYYHRVQTVITVAYAVILILALLPFLMKI